jgi:hypothetical protein
MERCSPGDMRPRTQNEPKLLFFSSEFVDLTPQSLTDKRLNYGLGFNIFCDAALATYPVHLFWSLQMKWRIKVALSILMGLGWMYVPLLLLLTMKLNYLRLTQTVLENRAAVCSAFKCYELKALTETNDITCA